MRCADEYLGSLVEDAWALGQVRSKPSSSKHMSLPCLSPTHKTLPEPSESADRAAANGLKALPHGPRAILKANALFVLSLSLLSLAWRSRRCPSSIIILISLPPPSLPPSTHSASACVGKAGIFLGRAESKVGGRGAAAGSVPAFIMRMHLASLPLFFCHAVAPFSLLGHAQAPSPCARTSIAASRRALK